MFLQAKNGICDITELDISKFFPSDSLTLLVSSIIKSTTSQTSSLHSKVLRSRTPPTKTGISAVYGNL